MVVMMIDNRIYNLKKNSHQAISVMVVMIIIGLFHLFQKASHQAMAPCLRLRRDGEEPLPNHKESGFLSQPQWKDIHVPFDIHVALAQYLV